MCHRQIALPARNFTLLVLVLIVINHGVNNWIQVLERLRGGGVQGRSPGGGVGGRNPPKEKNTNLKALEIE